MNDFEGICVVLGGMVGLPVLLSYVTCYLADRSCKKAAEPAKPSPAPLSRGTKIFIGAFALWLLAILVGASSNSDKRSSARYQSSKEAGLQQIPPASDSTPTDPSAGAPRSVLSYSELNSWYARLSIQRQALPQGNPAALESFNREAAMYTADVSLYASQPPILRTAEFATAQFDSASFAPALSPNLGSATRGENRYFDSTYRPSVAEHYVGPSARSNGVLVQGHYSTNPDGSFWNNYSSQGNVNPHTGRVGTAAPRISSPYSGRSITSGRSVGR